MEADTKEAGLQTLQAEGLKLQEVDDEAVTRALNLVLSPMPPLRSGDVFEALRWVVPDPSRPDTMPGEGERVVLMYDFKGERNWESCWYDQLLKLWVVCETCADLEGTALFWAKPKGPKL